MSVAYRKNSMENDTKFEMADLGPAVTIVETCVCLLLNIISLNGNFLVCLAVYKNSRLRTTTNIYIIGLALTDLLSATFVMPFTSGVLITRKWPYGNLYCNIQAFLVNFGLFTSTSIMGLTAFNRYVRIVHTNRYNNIFSRFKSRIILASLCVIIASYIAIPGLTGLQNFEFVPEYATCHITHASEEVMIVHYCVVVFFFLIFPFSLATFCYVKVFRTITQHNLEVAPNLQSRIRDAQITTQEIKISKSLFVVVLGFGICWIPAWMLALIMRFSAFPSLPREFFLIHTALVFLSSSTNVFIYAGMNNSFKAEFRRLLSCEIRVKLSAKVSPNFGGRRPVELRFPRKFSG